MVRILDSLFLILAVLLEVESIFEFNHITFKTHSLKLIIHLLRMFNMVIIISQFQNYRFITKDRNIKTNIMQVISFLYQIDDKIVEDRLAEDLHWSIKMIQSDMLYDLDNIRDEGNEEKNRFIDQYDEKTINSAQLK